MHSFIDVEDSAEGVVGFKNGFYACFYLMNYYSYDADTQVEIDCEKGRVQMIKDSAYIKYCKGGREKAEPKAGEYMDYGGGVRDYWGYCHCNQIKDFYDALRSGRRPAITAEDAFETQRLVWAVYESSRRGRRVRLD
jgi:predicted dehydrogenase